MLRGLVEKLSVRVSQLPVIGQSLDRIALDRAVIFMLHRMRDERDGVEGHDPAVLRECLAMIRKLRLELVSVQELLERAATGAVGKKGLVAFSLDDGYRDQAEVAGPIFAEFDCPATYFLITGLIDGELWPWDARLEFALLNMLRPEVSVALAGQALTLPTSTPAERQRTKRLLRGLLKFYPQPVIDAVVAEVCAQAGLDPNLKPPPGYTPMSWSDVARLERSGMRFAPHTVSHGIVARMDDAAARFEIEHSWQRIRAEVSAPQRVFAWPNGRDIDAGGREYDLLKRLGFVGAVTTEYETVRLDGCLTAQTKASLLSVGRIGLPSSPHKGAFLASGVGKAISVVTERLDASYGGYAGLARRVQGRMRTALRERNGASVAWPDVRRLVFVCRGNICRSVFAERFAQTLGMSAISYGTDARAGSPADDGAIRAALRRSVDLRDHRSRRFALRELQPGDLVLTFDDHQRNQLQALDWGEGTQYSSLGLWGDPRWTVIADPYGRGEAYFDTCFRYIENCIERVRQRIGPRHST